MIHVTETFLPPIAEYQSWIQKVFDKKWLTNRGILVLELEDRLKKHLEVDWITVTNNGTVPIQIALKLLANQGEVITTPFSYVATTSAIVWGNCTPVFVDIHPDYLTIDETKIEAAITEKTTCILATHVFGNPCNIGAIEKIAKKFKLKVIYDAAHCFGVKYQGQCIFNYGDVSTCSFHATKLFHTAEGGAMFCSDKELQKELFYSHNFGHNGPVDFHGAGINAKLSELQAAMGLSVLPYMGAIVKQRKEIVDHYNRFLDFTKVKGMKLRDGVDWNYSYYPILFKNEAELLLVVEKLNEIDVFPRRYFYPSLNTLNYVINDVMEVAESISSKILCLPLYAGLKLEDIKKIIGIINKNI